MGVKGVNVSVKLKALSRVANIEATKFIRAEQSRHTRPSDGRIDPGGKPPKPEL